MKIPNFLLRNSGIAAIQCGIQTVLARGLVLYGSAITTRNQYNIVNGFVSSRAWRRSNMNCKAAIGIASQRLQLRTSYCMIGVAIKSRRRLHYVSCVSVFGFYAHHAGASFFGCIGCLRYLRCLSARFAKHVGVLPTVGRFTFGRCERSF
jgi:hypothetical protein